MARAPAPYASPFPCVVLDTETTGIWGRDIWTETVELGAVALNAEGIEVASFSRFIRPRVLDARARPALEVNHIPVDVLRHADDAQTVLYAFLAWLPEGAVCTAYNIGFDRQSLQHMNAWDLVWGPCVLQRARRELPKPHKLENVVATLGLTVEGAAHRALTDARTAARVLYALDQRAQAVSRG